MPQARECYRFIRPQRPAKPATAKPGQQAILSAPDQQGGGKWLWPGFIQRSKTLKTAHEIRQPTQIFRALVQLIEVFQKRRVLTTAATKEKTQKGGAADTTP
jgi:hypothetical protein